MSSLRKGMPNSLVFVSITILLFTVSGMVVAQGDCDLDDAGLLYTRASGKQDDGNYEGAITDYTCAIELNPDYADAYLGRGQSRYFLRHFEQAFEDFSYVIELDPENSVAYGGRGWSYLYLDDPRNAILDLNRAIELDPDYTVAYNGRGRSYYFLGLYEQALEDFNRVIELEPENNVAYVWRGWSYFESDDHENATLDFDRAIELDPDFAGAYVGRGWSYFERDGFEINAALDFSIAIELDPDLTGAYLGRGQSLYVLARYEQALADLNEYVERAGEENVAPEILDRIAELETHIASELEADTEQESDDYPGVVITRELSFWGRNILGGFADVVPSTWIAESEELARYEIHLLAHETFVETCSYTGNLRLHRIQIDVEVTISDLLTGEQVDNHTFTGSEPEACPETITVNQEQTVSWTIGNPVSADFEQWLLDTQITADMPGMP